VLRRGLLVAGAVVLVSLAASLAFGVATLSTRPLEYVEGSVLFEATRIRLGQTLYTDPLVGVFDYGPVPVRYYVLYPPLWAFLLSLSPVGVAPAVGRVLSLVAWYGLLAFLGWGAYRRQRPLGVLAAAFVGGVYTLTLYGASARPDALAVALATLGLERRVRAKGTASVAMGGLFALAAWLKPNVLGLGVGALGSCLKARRGSTHGAREAGLGGALLGLALVSLAIVLVLERVSHGAFWLHLTRATWQPLSLELWVEQISSRPQFFALLIVFALVAGVASWGDPGVRMATLALTTSLVWTLISLAKIGSATCYWMEPSVGAVVVLAHAKVPSLSPRWSLLALLAPLQALWTGVASIRSSLESIEGSPAKARLFEELRTASGEGSLWLSDDAGIELALNGRLIDTPFQTTSLVRAGKFPEQLWLADVTRPEILGVVTSSDILERPLSDLDEAHDRYPLALRRVLRERFPRTSREAGFYVYLRR
jgi:hypothetical protein